MLFIVGGLLIGDSLLTSLWAIVDPMNRQIRNLTMEVRYRYLIKLKSQTGLLLVNCVSFVQNCYIKSRMSP